MNWKEKILAAMKRYQIALAFMVGAPFGWVVVRYWPSDPGNAAAWAQAITAPIAVVGVYWAAKVQAKATLDSVAESYGLAQRSRRGSMIAIAYAAYKLLQDHHDEILAAKNDKYKNEPLPRAAMVVSGSDFHVMANNIINIFNKIDVSQFADVIDIDYFIKFQQAFIVVISRSDLCRTSPLKDPDLKSHFERMTSEVERFDGIKRVMTKRVENLEKSIFHAKDMYLKFREKQPLMDQLR